MFNSVQLTLPGFETYLRCSRWRGMASIRNGLMVCKSFLGRAIASLASRLPRDWRAKRMAQTFYTLPPGPPLIEHFALLKVVGTIVVYEFMSAPEWYALPRFDDLFLGNYFTTTYHCSFCWDACELSTLEAYDLIKKFYHPRGV